MRLHESQLCSPFLIQFALGMRSHRSASALKAALLLAVALRMVGLTSFHDAGDNDLGAASSGGWHAGSPSADSCPACRLDTVLLGSPAVAPPIDAPANAIVMVALPELSPASLTVPPGVGRGPPLADLA